MGITPRGRLLPFLGSKPQEVNMSKLKILKGLKIKKILKMPLGDIKKITFKTTGVSHE